MPHFENILTKHVELEKMLNGFIEVGLTDYTAHIQEGKSRATVVCMQNNIITTKQSYKNQLSVSHTQNC